MLCHAACLISLRPVLNTFQQLLLGALRIDAANMQELAILVDQASTVRFRGTWLAYHSHAFLPVRQLTSP